MSVFPLHHRLELRAVVPVAVAPLNVLPGALLVALCSTSERSSFLCIDPLTAHTAWVPADATVIASEDPNTPNPYAHAVMQLFDVGMALPDLAPPVYSLPQSGQQPQPLPQPAAAAAAAKKPPRKRIRDKVRDKEYELGRKAEGRRGHGANLIRGQQGRFSRPYPESIDSLLQILVDVQPSCNVGGYSSGTSVTGTSNGTSTANGNGTGTGGGGMQDSNAQQMAYAFTDSAQSHARATVASYAQQKIWRVWLPELIWRRFNILKVRCTRPGTTVAEFIELLLNFAQRVEGGSDGGVANVNMAMVEVRPSASSLSIRDSITLAAHADDASYLWKDVTPATGSASPTPSPLQSVAIGTQQSLLAPQPQVTVKQEPIVDANAIAMLLDSLEADFLSTMQNPAMDTAFASSASHLFPAEQQLETTPTIFSPDELAKLLDLPVASGLVGPGSDGITTPLFGLSSASDFSQLSPSLSGSANSAIDWFHLLDFVPPPATSPPPLMPSVSAVADGRFQSSTGFPDMIPSFAAAAAADAEYLQNIFPYNPFMDPFAGDFVRQPFVAPKLPGQMIYDGLDHSQQHHRYRPYVQHRDASPTVGSFFHRQSLGVVPLRKEIAQDSTPSSASTPSSSSSGNIETMDIDAHLTRPAHWADAYGPPDWNFRALLDPPDTKLPVHYGSNASSRKASVVAGSSNKGSQAAMHTDQPAESTQNRADRRASGMERKGSVIERAFVSFKSAFGTSTSVDDMDTFSPSVDESHSRAAATNAPASRFFRKGSAPVVSSSSGASGGGSFFRKPSAPVITLPVDVPRSASPEDDEDDVEDLDDLAHTLDAPLAMPPVVAPAVQAPGAAPPASLAQSTPPPVPAAPAQAQPSDEESSSKSESWLLLKEEADDSQKPMAGVMAKMVATPPPPPPPPAPVSTAPMLAHSRMPALPQDAAVSASAVPPQAPAPETMQSSVLRTAPQAHVGAELKKKRSAWRRESAPLPTKPSPVTAGSSKPSAPAAHQPVSAHKTVTKRPSFPKIAANFFGSRSRGGAIKGNASPSTSSTTVSADSSSSLLSPAVDDVERVSALLRDVKISSSPTPIASTDTTKQQKPQKEPQRAATTNAAGARRMAITTVVRLLGPFSASQVDALGQQPDKLPGRVMVTVGLVERLVDLGRVDELVVLDCARQLVGSFKGRDVAAPTLRLLARFVQRGLLPLSAIAGGGADASPGLEDGEEDVDYGDQDIDPAAVEEEEAAEDEIHS